MREFTYLLVDFCTVIIPLLFSFHPRLNFHKTWGAFLPAVFLTGLCFIIWDAWFTNLGVWGFNEQYLMDVMIGNLPVEEILFFICIPYACVFTFHCLNLLFLNGINTRLENVFTLSLIAALMITGILFFQKIYTSVTFLSLAVLLTVARYMFKVNWLGKFYIIYAILLLPFMVVNGILTGTGLENPVVWYNADEILGIRLYTIPLEDIFYGMELILLNVLIYQYFLDKKASFTKEVFSKA